MTATDMLPMFVGLALGGSLLAAVLGLFTGRKRPAMQVLFCASLGAGGLAGTAAGALMLSGAGGFGVELPVGLPWLRLHLQLDALGGTFLGLIGMVTIAVSMFAPRYTREYQRRRHSPGALGLATGLFVAGMQFVVLAGDAFGFMIAWELMSVASYLLVAYEHEESAHRRAAFIYLLMAQIGALLILLAFGVLSGFEGDFTFDALREKALEPPWPGIAFALALLGFGMKAGLVPLHVWLPEAHPAAPAHISALMSGVMLKVAIYGFIRFSFDLLGAPHWSWGVAVLLAGSITALYGVLYAIMQQELKRVLAYSSIENVGVIFIGLGLAITFIGTGHPALAALGLVAALYHCVSHALFKGLLFLGAGAVVQASHTGTLDQMGGLIRVMPWTALFFLVGCLGSAALPPFNGFVSEWLIFQTALQATVLDDGVLRAVIPVTAAMLALTGALAAACFVRAFGIAFLGQGRTRRVRHAREVSRGMIAGQGLLALLCLLFGILPTFAVAGLGRVAEGLTGYALSSATDRGWLWLTPVAPEVASYSAPLVFLGVGGALAVWAIAYLAVRRQRHGAPMPRSDAWDCGFGGTSARAQYTATAFSMPIRQVFEPVFELQEQTVREMQPELVTRPAHIRYLLHVEDRAWKIFYRPVERAVQRAARLIGRIQTGQLRHYLIYSFVTLLLLLWLIT